MGQKRGSMVVVALLVVMISGALWFVTSRWSVRTMEPVRTGKGLVNDAVVLTTTETPTATATLGYVVVSPPPGYPTAAVIDTRDKAIAFAKALFRDKGPWLEEYAVHTRYRYYQYWHSRTAGIAPLPTADPGLSPTAQQNWVMWLVGLRSEAPISRERVMSEMGLGGMGGASEPWMRYGGYEVYLAFDDAGMIYTVGLVDLPDDTGTPQPMPGWELSDIETLPTAAP